MTGMARLRATARWARTHYRSVTGFVAGMIVGCGLLAFAAMEGASDINRAHDPDKVGRDWIRTLEALGIKAVFPLSEDYHVGDLYAADQGAPGGAKPRLLFANIQIAHIPGTEAVLEATYKNLPQFPATPKDYDGAVPVEAMGDIFAPPATLRSLPIAAFPEVTVATASGQSVSGLLPWIRTALGAERSASESVQIKIPAAETYGIPAEAAELLLDQFCLPAPGQPNIACTERRVRLLLSSLIGADVLCTANVPPQDGVPGQTHIVNLFLINRVYLTRSINYVYGSDTEVAAAARAVLDSAAGVKSQATGAAAPSAGAAPQTPEQPQTQQQRLAAAQDRLRQDIAALGPAGTLSVASITSNGAVINQQFPRPVVIGYSALAESPIDNDGCVRRSQPKS
jgi:hypothetical protein